MKKIAYLLLLLSIVGCKKNTWTTGKLVFKQVDGCTWLIQKNDDTLMEPTNLYLYISNPKEGQKIRFNYHLAQSMSICMMGTLVTLDEVQ